MASSRVDGAQPTRAKPTGMAGGLILDPPIPGDRTPGPISMGDGLDGWEKPKRSTHSARSKKGAKSCRIRWIEIARVTPAPRSAREAREARMFAFAGLLTQR